MTPLFCMISSVALYTVSTSYEIFSLGSYAKLHLVSTIFEKFYETFLYKSSVGKSVGLNLFSLSGSSASFSSNTVDAGSVGWFEILFLYLVLILFISFRIVGILGVHLVWNIAWGVYYYLKGFVLESL